MRVITGMCRGKQLRAPTGLNTRPTTDRVKEAIFNIIQFQVEGARCLDLFCGSGQMGIEALSRGAAHCTFVDDGAEAQRVAGQNIRDCRLEDRAKLVRGDAFSFVRGQEAGSFDLIFLDPPYGGDLLNRALFLIQQFDILSSRGIILCESAKKDEISPVESPYLLGKSYKYGQICVTTIVKEER